MAQARVLDRLSIVKHGAYNFTIVISLFSVGLASTTQARLNTEPEFVVFASYSPPPKTPLRISTLREMVSEILAHRLMILVVLFLIAFVVCEVLVSNGILIFAAFTYTYSSRPYFYQ